MAWDAYAAALAGDFRRASALAGGTDEARAWGAALDAMRWAAEPAAARAPRVEEIAALTGASLEARAAASLACVAMERVAIASFDRPALDRWARAHAELVARGVPETGGAALWLRLVHASQRVLAGESRDAFGELRAIEAEAASAQLAPLVIDAATLSAIAALDAGELGLATSIARRASRMARTEGLPQHEYLAHLALARVRRHAGSPHLATRILAALDRVASPCWRGWIRWELALAGGAEGAGDARPRDEHARSSVAGAASVALESWLGAAARGDRGAALAHADETHALLGAAPALAHELDDLAIALDPLHDVREARAELVAWCAGATDDLPGPLVGPATLPGASGERGVAYAVVWPGGHARRVLGAGVALAGPDVVDVGGQGARPGRLETAIAVLALAGSAGLDNAELFRAVYGFVYVAALHRTVLDVLVHRVRAALGEAATLHHRDDRVWLEVHRPMRVADPRCERPVDDRVLRALARHGRCTARDAAEELGLPLRTVQTALKELVDDGACTVERQGRRVEYRIEDTTFSEPTIA